MRARIREAAPVAEERLKWGKPAFSYQMVLVIFAAFKNHIGFYPTPSAVRAFADLRTIFRFRNETARRITQGGALACKVNNGHFDDSSSKTDFSIPCPAYLSMKYFSDIYIS